MPRDPDPGADPASAEGPQSAPTTPTLPTGPRAEAARAALDGYQLGEPIGRGGMGEVVAAHQQRIGRGVAVKRMHGVPDAEATARFLREAKIQARLEHPAIVPVYDIGEDAAGHPFFAMKRLAGTTLAEVMRSEAQAQGLLRAFADVCLAIDFAHSRGVVHRDLKPANIVLGDFGEVYVLDWGLARVLGERDASTIGDDIQSADGMTIAGTMLGTPGYMAPEQVQDAGAVGTAADIYALGAILFELLARQPLHARGVQALHTTVLGVEGSPSTRCPDLTVAPELDALCVAALAMDPEARPTARQLARRLQQYLDGDRDVARRRELAADHLATARGALASGDAARRAEAMRAAGRALALDPESRDAADLVTSLMLEPPKELPAKLREELAASDIAAQRRQSRIASGLLATLAAVLLAAGWNGVLSLRLYVACVGFVLVLAFAAQRLSQRTPTARELLFGIVGNMVLVAVISRGFSSLILLPGVMCIMANSFVAYPLLIGRMRTIIALLVASWLVPILLETAGVVATTWNVTPGAITATSQMFVIGPGSTTALLIFGHLTMFVMTSVFAATLAKSRREAMRTVEIQAWHLRQLLPG